VSNAQGGHAQVSAAAEDEAPAADGEAATEGVTLASVTAEDAAGQAGGGTDPGQPADAESAQAFGGRRRRRAATREPGPPDSTAGTDAAAGGDGQAPAQTSAAAGV